MRGCGISKLGRMREGHVGVYRRINLGLGTSHHLDGEIKEMTDYEVLGVGDTDCVDEKH